MRILLLLLAVVLAVGVVTWDKFAPIRGAAAPNRSEFASRSPSSIADGVESTIASQHGGDSVPPFRDAVSAPGTRLGQAPLNEMDFPLEFAFSNVAQLITRADQGDASARHILARATLECAYGNHVNGCSEYLATAPVERALPWIEDAARGGLEIAQLRYLDATAQLLRDVDHPEYLLRRNAVATQTIEFLRVAAARGNDEAMLRLGSLYGNGRFIAYDPTNAYLFSLAAAWSMPENSMLSASELESKRPDLLRYRREVPPSSLGHVRNEARRIALCCG